MDPQEIRTKNSHALHLLMCVVAVAGFYTIWAMGTAEETLANTLAPVLTRHMADIEAASLQ